MTTSTPAPPPDTTPLVRVRGLCKEFAAKPHPVKVLNDINFDIQPGETFGIVGESGSGKTTCARCILRALQPTSGSVEFTTGGQTVDLATLSERALKPLRRQM